MVLHVRKFGSTSMVWSRIPARRWHICLTLFSKLKCPWYLHSIRTETHKMSQTVYICAMDRKSKKLRNAIFKNDVRTVTGDPKKKRIVQQTVIALKSDSFELFVSTMPGPRHVDSKLQAWGREQVIVPWDVADIVSLIPCNVLLTNVYTKIVYPPEKRCCVIRNLQRYGSSLENHLDEGTASAELLQLSNWSKAKKRVCWTIRYQEKWRRSSWVTLE